MGAEKSLPRHWFTLVTSPRLCYSIGPCGEERNTEARVEHGGQGGTRRPGWNTEARVEHGGQGGTRRPGWNTEARVEHGVQGGTRRPGWNTEARVELGGQGGTRRPGWNTEARVGYGGQGGTRSPGWNTEARVEHGGQGGTRRPGWGTVPNSDDRIPDREDSHWPSDKKPEHIRNPWLFHDQNQDNFWKYHHTRPMIYESVCYLGIRPFLREQPSGIVSDISLEAPREGSIWYDTRGLPLKEGSFRRGTICMFVGMRVVIRGIDGGMLGE